MFDVVKVAQHDKELYDHLCKTVGQSGYFRIEYQADPSADTVLFQHVIERGSNGQVRGREAVLVKLKPWLDAVASGSLPDRIESSRRGWEQGIRQRRAASVAHPHDAVGGLLFKHDSNDLLNFMNEVNAASKALALDVGTFEIRMAAERLKDPEHMHTGVTGGDWNALNLYLYGPPAGENEDGTIIPSEPDPVKRWGWLNYYHKYSPIGWRITSTQTIWNETENYEKRLAELYDIFSTYDLKMSQPRPKLGSQDPSAEKDLRDTASRTLSGAVDIILLVGGFFLARELLAARRGK